MIDVYHVPQDIPRLHDALVQPLLRATDFSGHAYAENGELETTFFVQGEAVTSRRLMLFGRRERVELLERRAHWRGCRDVAVFDEHGIGVYKLHSITADDSTVRLRAEPDLVIEISCELVELGPPSSSDYEMERSYLGTWMYGSRDALLTTTMR